MSTMKYTVDGDLISVDARLDEFALRGNMEKAKRNEEIASLQNRLSIVEDMLCILNRDLDYEDKYPELRSAYNQYNRVLAKYKTFNILTDDGNNK